MKLAPTVTDSIEITDRKIGAQMLGLDIRKNMALHVLAGGRPTEIARVNQVSRKFVYGQSTIARQAIDSVFNRMPVDEERVLFHIPVTKSLIRQIVLVLLLRCHASYRGVIAFFGDLFGYNISLGTIHNIVAAVVSKAETVTTSVNLMNAKTGCHDEIYQAGKPVLVGIDARSTYCYLLAAAEHADGETWGCELLDLIARGLCLDTVVADLGSGLRRGQELAMPNVPCFADIFHVFRDMSDIFRYYERKHAGAVTSRKSLDDKMASLELRGKKRTRHSRSLGAARAREKSLSELITSLQILFDWMRNDVLTLAGAGFDERSITFDFIITELRLQESERGKLISLRKRLENHKDELLGFAKKLDYQLDKVAMTHKVPKDLLQRLCIALGMNESDINRYRIESDIWLLVGSRLHDIRTDVEQLLASTVRASSLVEMTNSILRSYFFLRRQAGAEYLKLLQFYLNHRVLKESERPERIGKSPREILSGESHAHWLELLGFIRLQPCA